MPIELVFCRNQITYEEILSWRGFSFEQSHVLKQAEPIRTIETLVFEVENGTYGIEESDRIIARHGLIVEVN